MESKEITTGDQGMAFVATKENLDLLKKTLASQDVNLTDAEFQLTVYTAEKRGLNPLIRQMYVMKDWRGKLSFITSIDGYRLIAERTKRYEGQTETMWCGPDGKWLDVWLKKEPPAAAKVGVYKKGFREPVYGVATYNGYVQTKKDGSPSGQWAKMPDIMLAKCAESLALRKAFPEDLSNLYTTEEMGQADFEGEVVTPTFTDPSVPEADNHIDDSTDIMDIETEPRHTTYSEIKARAEAPATPAQLRAVMAAIGDKIKAPAKQAKIIYAMANIKSRTELTFEGASALIKRLEASSKADLETVYEIATAPKVEESDEPFPS